MMEYFENPCAMMRVETPRTPRRAAQQRIRDTASASASVTCDRTIWSVSDGNTAEHTQQRDVVSCVHSQPVLTDDVTWRSSMKHEMSDDALPQHLHESDKGTLASLHGHFHGSWCSSTKQQMSCRALPQHHGTFNESTTRAGRNDCLISHVSQ